LSVLRNNKIQINGKVFQAGTLDIRCFLIVALKACTELTSLMSYLVVSISPDKARKGVIYPLKTGIYALVGISERTFTR